MSIHASIILCDQVVIAIEIFIRNCKYTKSQRKYYGDSNLHIYLNISLSLRFYHILSYVCQLINLFLISGRFS